MIVFLVIFIGYYFYLMCVVVCIVVVVIYDYFEVISFDIKVVVLCFIDFRKMLLYEVVFDIIGVVL